MTTSDTLDALACIRAVGADDLEGLRVLLDAADLRALAAHLASVGYTLAQNCPPGLLDSLHAFVVAEDRGEPQWPDDDDERR